ncbi:hypothetical protein [Halalkalibacter lacteus]|uniref:hypothetical protein n=1 Tax=Halalkalibacter lacteus TaxID=3090663 RepID=UPI002FCC1F2A
MKNLQSQLTALMQENQENITELLRKQEELHDQILQLVNNCEAQESHPDLLESFYSQSIRREKLE